MKTSITHSGVPHELRLAYVNPFLSLTVLECVGDDMDSAFKELQRFLRKIANDRGRANEARVWAERTVCAREVIDEVGVLGELGFDGLFFIARELVKVPGWVSKDSGLSDVVQQLIMALRRNRLVPIYAEPGAAADLGPPDRGVPVRVAAGDGRYVQR